MAQLLIDKQGYTVPSKTIEGVKFTILPISNRVKYGLVHGIFKSLAAEQDLDKTDTYDIFRIVDAIDDLITIEELNVKDEDENVTPVTSLKQIGDLPTHASDSATILVQLVSEVIVAFCNFIQGSEIEGTSAKK